MWAQIYTSLSLYHNNSKHVTNFHLRRRGCSINLLTLSSRPVYTSTRRIPGGFKNVDHHDRPCGNRFNWRRDSWEHTSRRRKGYWHTSKYIHTYEECVWNLVNSYWYYFIVITCLVVARRSSVHDAPIQIDGPSVKAVVLLLWLPANLFPISLSHILSFFL